MRAGKLRHRITIEQNTPTRDALGAEVDSWSSFAVRWAAVEPLGGREFWDARRVNAERRVRFRLRYVVGVTPEMRVSFDGRVFDIQAVIDVEERNRELQLVCEEQV